MSNPLIAPTVAAADPTATAGSIVIRGRNLTYRTWGDPSNDVVLLVHGATANQRWWDGIAPHLASNGRAVATMDLSGHGDSGHHDEYTYRGWASEVLALAEHAGDGRPVTLIGHSMGGAICLLAAQKDPESVRRVVTIDTMIRDVPEQEAAARRERAGRHHRRYPTAEAVLEAFRTLPPSSRIPGEVLRDIAALSITPVPGGWSWKFDLRVLGLDLVTPGQLTPASVPTVLIRGDDGLVDEKMEARILGRLGGLARSRTITDCGHHAMLERPTALLRELELALVRIDHQ